MVKTLSRRLALFVAAAALVGGAAAVDASPAAAGSCSTTWAYLGGSTSTGGCKGTGGGTHFRVAQVCGWTTTRTYSAWIWAPHGVAKSATTKACPWWSQKARVAWVEY